MNKFENLKELTDMEEDFGLNPGDETTEIPKGFSIETTDNDQLIIRCPDGTVYDLLGRYVNVGASKSRFYAAIVPDDTTVVLIFQTYYSWDVKALIKSRTGYDLYFAYSGNDKFTFEAYGSCYIDGKYVNLSGIKKYKRTGIGFLKNLSLSTVAEKCTVSRSVDRRVRMTRLYKELEEKPQFSFYN